MTRNQKAETAAKALVTQWFEPCGIPQRIHSVNGRNFDSVLISELCKLYGIQRSHTTIQLEMANESGLKGVATK